MVLLLLPHITAATYKNAEPHVDPFSTTAGK
jgi:hypothetical protein